MRLPIYGQLYAADAFDRCAPDFAHHSRGDVWARQQIFVHTHIYVYIFTRVYVYMLRASLARRLLGLAHKYLYTHIYMEMYFRQQIFVGQATSICLNNYMYKISIYCLYAELAYLIGSDVWECSCLLLLFK
jgi:hypothetical protein